MLLFFLTLELKSAGHVITGDVNIVNNDDLNSPIIKGPKFRKPRFFNWRYTFIHIINSAEEIVKRWAKHENEEIYKLSEWAESVRSMAKPRIKRIMRRLKTNYPSLCNN